MLEVVFTFRQTKRHEQVQCQMPMANEAETKECADDKLKESFSKET